ncbi:putative gastrointestinal growth factor xP4 isoform X1 [Orbicella faveolata]|uniref:putative gastrointestinal growth factor xP4 isoform X1 n=2 Tax=Orbicella faveolata TaxID=48498 RepID=UPI0009E3866C|nr:putative gastrointestinal growth factor xP4 isoform X1 [Orbicella faveolata]
MRRSVYTLVLNGILLHNYLTQKFQKHNNMEGQFVVVMLLFGAVAVMGNSPLDDEGSCDQDYRFECGWLGIDEQTCLARNCCWDNSDPSKKFCFVKKGTHLPDGLCPVAPSEREECGYYGITKEECLGKSCCWDPTVPNTKWCFKQPKEKPLGCTIYHGIYGTCKYVCDPDEEKMYGMGACQGRICCYHGYPSK